MVNLHGISGALAIRNRQKGGNKRAKAAPKKRRLPRNPSTVPSQSLPAEIHGVKAAVSPSRGHSIPVGRQPDRWPVAEIREEGLSEDEDELPNGKSAWKGTSETRRSSRKRIGGKNKVGDSSIAAQKDKSVPPNHKQTGVVNILLYVGFALMGLGLIMTFVGMGERGFKTKELQLIGPSLIGSGVLFTLLRILFCSFSTIPCKRKKPLDEKSLLSPSQETLAGAPPSPVPQPPRRITPAREPSKLPQLRQIPIIQPPRTPLSPAKSQPIPNLIEDEVESDTDLGLDVQYVEEEKSKKSSRASTARSTLTQVEKVESHFSPNNEEVVLNPSKLVDLNNG